MSKSEENPSGIHVWLILMKAYQALQQHAEKSIRATGLCFSDFTALEVLLHKGPLPINAIGEKVFLTSGSLTAAIDRLERRGLVERRAEPGGDRRVRIIHLTQQGKDFIQPLFNRHTQEMELATSGLTNTERITLIELLKKLGRDAASRL